MLASIDKEIYNMIMKSADFRADYNVEDSGKGIFFGVALSQFLAIVLLSTISSAVLVYSNLLSLSLDDVYIYLSLVVMQVIFGSIYLMYNNVAKVKYSAAFSYDKAKTNKSKKTTALNVLLVIAISLTLLFSLNEFTYLFSKIVSLTGYLMPTASFPFDITSIGGLFIGIFFLAILPSIFEEILFRGVIANGLKTKSVIKMVMISSLAFALVHFGLHQFVYQFFLGIMLSLVFMYTNKLWLAMLLHFLNNFLVLIFSHFNFSYTIYESITINGVIDVIVPIAIAIGGVLCLAGLTFLLYKNNKNNISEESIIKIEEEKIIVEEVEIQKIETSNDVVENTQPVTIKKHIKKTNWLKLSIILSIAVYIIIVGVNFL